MNFSSLQYNHDRNRVIGKNLNKIYDNNHKHDSKKYTTRRKNKLKKVPTASSDELSANILSENKKIWGRSIMQTLEQSKLKFLGQEQLTITNYRSSYKLGFVTTLAILSFLGTANAENVYQQSTSAANNDSDNIDFSIGDYGSSNPLDISINTTNSQVTNPKVYRKSDGPENMDIYSHHKPPRKCKKTVLKEECFHAKEIKEKSSGIENIKLTNNNLECNPNDMFEEREVEVDETDLCLLENGNLAIISDDNFSDFQEDYEEFEDEIFDLVETTKAPEITEEPIQPFTIPHELPPKISVQPLPQNKSQVLVRSLSGLELLRTKAFFNSNIDGVITASLRFKSAQTRSDFFSRVDTLNITNGEPIKPLAHQFINNEVKDLKVLRDITTGGKFVSQVNLTFNGYARVVGAVATNAEGLMAVNIDPSQFSHYPKQVESELRSLAIQDFIENADKVYENKALIGNNTVKEKSEFQLQNSLCIDELIILGNGISHELATDNVLTTLLLSSEIGQNATMLTTGEKPVYKSSLTDRIVSQICSLCPDIKLHDIRVPPTVTSYGKTATLTTNDLVDGINAILTIIQNGHDPDAIVIIEDTEVPEYQPHANIVGALLGGIRRSGIIPYSLLSSRASWLRKIPQIENTETVVKAIFKDIHSNPGSNYKELLKGLGYFVLGSSVFVIPAISVALYIKRKAPIHENSQSGVDTRFSIENTTSENYEVIPLNDIKTNKLSDSDGQEVENMPLQQNMIKNPDIADMNKHCASVLAHMRHQRGELIFNPHRSKIM